MTRLLQAALMASAALPALAAAAYTQEAETAAPRGVDRVIVTAQRREADSQDVPIALTAIGAEELERQAIEEITDLRFTAPNVNIQKNTGVANAAQVYIRGVGQDESSLFAEVGVGIYLDGVYLGKQNGTTIDLLDLDRIEVLRGPQGTYYGRNTNGGAIRFISRRPELTGTRGVLDLAVGTHDRLDARASWSSAIVEGVSGFKIDIFSRNMGSDFDLLNTPAATAGPFTYQPQSTVNNVERYGARGSFLWEPSDRDMSVYIVGDWTIDNSGAFLPTPIQRQADGSVNEPFGRRAGNMSIAPFHEYRGGGISGEVRFGTQLGDITSITAYRTFSQDLTADVDGPGIVDLYQELDQWQFTQEVQLVGGNDQVDYVLGAYYFRENVEQLANNRFNQIFSFLIGQPFGLNDDVQDTTSWAVFGETTFHMNDQWSFTLGGRYTSDEKTANRRLLNPTTLAPIWEVDPSFDDTNFSWRAVAQYRPNENLMVYGSYSTGYKAGGLAGTRPITTNVAFNIYEPEELSSWEVGLRSDLADNTLRFNATYFYSIYDALQLSVLEPATFQFGVINADAIVHGLELEGVWAPTDQFQLSGNLGTTNFRYDEGSRVDPAVGLPFDTLDGKQFPDLSARLNAVFFQPTELGEFAFGGSATHSSAFARNVRNTPDIFSDAVTTFDLFAQLTSPDGRWRLKLEGKNITDEDIFLAGNAPGAAPGSFGSRYYTYGAIWSASLRLEF